MKDCCRSTLKPYNWKDVNYNKVVCVVKEVSSQFSFGAHTEYISNYDAEYQKLIRLDNLNIISNPNINSSCKWTINSSLIHHWSSLSERRELFASNMNHGPFPNGILEDALLWADQKANAFLYFLIEHTNNILM